MSEKDKETSASKMMALLQSHDTHLFKDRNETPYISISRNGHVETWLIGSSEFDGILNFMFYQEFNKTLSAYALQDVTNTLKGAALYSGSVVDVFLRVGLHDGKYYLDLADEHWRVVEIRADGWDVVANPPVRFRRTASMRSLPQPMPGQSVNELLRFVNIDLQDFPLVLAWLLEALRPETAYPVLELSGQQGSAKSTTQRLLRQLIDPNKAGLRTAPRSEEDLAIAAANNWIVSLNNLSHLKDSQQDLLCSMSTGGGFACRKLYTTFDEVVIDTKRPVVMNGINRLAVRQDLVDRTIQLELPEISKANRTDEKSLDGSFEEWHPFLLGALLDLFCSTLNHLPSVNLGQPPRMADFAVLGEAMTQVMGHAESFCALYERKRLEAIREALESSPVALALEQFMGDKPYWESTVKQLYDVLSEVPHDYCGWPKAARGLKSVLRRAKPALESVGISLEFPKQRTANGYMIVVRNERYEQHVPEHAYSQPLGCDLM